MENNDIAGALGKLLEDPATLAKAMSIASSLMGSMPQNTSSPESQNPPPEKEVFATPDASASEFAESGDVSAQTNSNADIGAPSVGAIAQLLGGGSASTVDPRCALLYALKPYMGHGRDEKIDTLVNMMRLARLAGGMFGDKPHGRE